MLKSVSRFICVFFLLTALTSPVSAQWVIDLNVPLYGQETSYWCGAASAQMIMNGYPNPANCVYIQQSVIWNVIQNNNLPGEPANWATDPHGLQQALLILNPPPAGTWALMTNPDRDALMFQVLFWMNFNHYPVATLVYEAAHWVVIKGYETDIEPLQGTNPVLQMITINNPWPPNQGVTTTMTGTIWFSNYWYGPVNAPGTWYGQYVAIIEPPIHQGEVEVQMEIRAGEKSRVISPEQAAAYAQYWIDQLNLASKDVSYSILAADGTTYLYPVLVREEVTAGPGDTVAPYYYIVPYGSQEDVDNGCAEVCVMVNAFSGNFEEIGSFGEARGYIDEDMAIEAAARALKLKPEDTRDAQAEVVFIPCDITYLRISPLWRIVINEQTVYVEMNGTVHITFQPAPPVYGK